MDSIITYLLYIIQYQYKQICWLILFIAKFIPLKQWAFDDVHSSKYQKFKTDKLPIIKPFFKQDWQFLLKFYEWKYNKTLKPVQRQFSALFVVLLTIISMITTVEKVNINAKFVLRLL